MTCIVLAGGRSLRLGGDKALEELGGESLILRVIRGLVPLRTEIIVVTGTGKEAPLPRGLRVKTVADVYPERGPLAGVHAGLLAAGSSHSLVVGSDMPFLNRRLIRYMMEMCGPYDVVIPRHRGGLEPLHAVYAKTCLKPIEAVLEKGENRIVAFFPGMNVRYVEEAEMERFDREHLSFFNINTQADLDRARCLLGAGGGRVGPPADEG